MTEAIASAVVGQLRSIALNKLQEHFWLVMGAKGDVEKLTISFEAIQAVLYDAEIKKITDTNVKFWLQRFRDVAYEMDDIIDHWITETLKPQTDNYTDGASSSSNNKTICEFLNMVYSFFFSFCCCFGEVIPRREVGLKIKELRQKLDAIVREKDALSLINNFPDHPAGERLPSSSIVDESETFGRNEDRKMISGMLLDDSSRNTPTNPFIISIIGMGGLGKTTLAQLVYNEDGMKSYFNLVIWVSVSDYFDQTRIAKEIIRGAGVHVPEHLSEWNDDLHKRLCESVKKKRFLLVLDDMWIDSPEDVKKWELFRVAFKNAAQGSRILVTTRNQSVAEKINSNYNHPLGILSKKKCWKFFSHLAFHPEGKNANKKGIRIWKKTGIAIAERCKGLPLSAKVLGNLLRQKDKIEDWKKVMDNNFIWDLENGILKPALLLSYYDLTPPVRACFVYSAIFPKGHQIHKDELIGMWMAQGLLVSTEPGGGEAVGQDYFDCLAARSFFQNFVKGWDGNIIHCDMHDLVHDFAKFLTRGEYITLTGSSSYPQSQNPRHLTWYSENSFNADSLPFSTLHGEKNLRTFQVLVMNRKPLQLKIMLPDLLCRLKYLRVLIIEHCDLECLPTEIEKLIHLRYLDLSGNSRLTELPDSLCSLYNLQTLDVSHCERFRNLPEELGRMINLRHLRFEDTHLLQYLPRGIGNLTALHTLTRFNVEVASGSNIKLLKNLNHLEGHLSVYRLDQVQNSDDAYGAMLNNKRNLKSLLLDFAGIKYHRRLQRKYSELELLRKYSELELSDDEDIKQAALEKVHDVLTALEPPSLLGKLNIMNYRGSRFSNWIASDEMLSNLCNLELDRCNCVELPALGILPSLENLGIHNMHQLKHIGPEFYGGGHDNRVAFPQLKTLRISGAHGLEDWYDFSLLRSRDVDVMPSLQEVELLYCLSLKVLPPFGKLRSLERLTISGLSRLEHIGTEFYGDGAGCADTVAFPKLKKLRIEGASILEKWDTSATLGMPCLRELELIDFHCLRVLPDFGELPLLQYLNIDRFYKLKHTGHGFHGDIGGHSVRVVFPKLEKLEIEKAHILEEWDTFTTAGAGPEGFDVMQCLRELSFSYCGFKALPGLGKFQLLESLVISSLKHLKCIGSEFYGAGGGDHANRVAFPKLKKFRIYGADNLDEWTLSAEECGDQMTIIMPCLREVNITKCGALQKLPALGKLQSLEILSINDMDSLKEIGNEFYGINGGDINVVSFPKLLSLKLDVELERWDFRMDAEEDLIMPRLRFIRIRGLKLRTLPVLGKLPSLETLEIRDLDNVEHIGPEFYGSTDVATTEAIFPKLHRLRLEHMRNLKSWEPESAESSTSLMPCLRDLKISYCHNLESLPRHLSQTLIYLSWNGSRLTTPPTLGQLKVLQKLSISWCSWEYMPAKIQDFHNLRTLNIEYSKDLEAHCTGDGWKIISHIPNIRIGGQIIRGHLD